MRRKAQSTKKAEELYQDFGKLLGSAFCGCAATRFLPQNQEMWPSWQNNRLGNDVPFRESRKLTSYATFPIQMLRNWYIAGQKNQNEDASSVPKSIILPARGRFLVLGCNCA
jgi:hypothetical protein